MLTTSAVAEKFPVKWDHYTISFFSTISTKALIYITFLTNGRHLQTLIQS